RRCLHRSNQATPSSPRPLRSLSRARVVTPRSHVREGELMNERERIDVELGVAQVVEEGRAGGHRIIAMAYRSAPPPARWDEATSQSPEFWPMDVGMSIEVALEWTGRLARAKPGVAFYGSTFRAILLPGSVPKDEDPRSPTFGQIVDRNNGGLK